MKWWAWQPLLTSDDVRYLHQVVIDNICKMICRKLICTFVQNLVIKDVTFYTYISANHVVNMNFLSWFYKKSYYILSTIVNECLNFILGHRKGIAHEHTRMAVILEILNLITLCFQFLWSIEGNICLACVKKHFDIFLVYVTPLALPVRTFLSANTHTLIELYSKPFKWLYDIFLCSGHKAVWVCILNSEDKITTVLTCKQIVV